MWVSGGWVGKLWLGEGRLGDCVDEWRVLVGGVVLWGCPMTSPHLKLSTVITAD